MQGLRLLFPILLLFGCRPGEPNTLRPVDKDLVLPTRPFNYAHPELPAWFSDPFIQFQNNTPATNPVTDWGATLGRVLFYDKRLSLNNSTACASCHIQSLGFGDSLQFSKGFRGGETRRHSMSLLNAAFYSNGRFFWDERAGSLEEQILQPIHDPVEMGMSTENLLLRLRSVTWYPYLFEKAFGDPEITESRIAKAMSQFIRAMVTFRSRYDLGRSMVADRLQAFPNFSEAENRGKQIFMTHPKVNCASCHITDLFILDNPRNNGLQFPTLDSGIVSHTQNPADAGKFKSPSLRNMGLRRHFMHNGSLHSLEEVIEHYNSGMLPDANLDNHLFDLSTNSPARMDLSEQDKAALKAFLLTLTDEEIIRDEKFSNPFR
jgi:cytochrome c peroxidase